MIVECPRCRARYRVEQDLLERDQTFKCSRCAHIFAYEASDAQPAEPEASVPPPEPPRPEARRTPTRREADSLSFSFSPGHEGTQETEEPDPATSQRASVAAAAAHDRDFSFEDDESAREDGDDHDTVVDDDEPRFVRGEDELRAEDRREGGGGRPYLIFLAALVIGYGILTLDLLNHPARAERLLAAVPIVGDVLAEDHLLQTRVQMQDVEGVYQQIKDDRLVFIVSGRAVNTAPASLKGVQIESALYDGSGKPLETKSIYCGNAMSLKIVKDLSMKEISLLQRLEPPKRFEIRSGESAGFSVVFLNPPAGLREFTARVVAAQPAV